MRLGRAATAALLLAVLASSTHAAGAAPAGAVPAGAVPAGAVPAGTARRHPCLYDPASRQLRRCLQFSFGRCYAWGERCSKRSQ
jgi:hypothetical protein